MSILSAFKKTTDVVCNAVISARAAIRTFNRASKQALSNNKRSNATQKMLEQQKRAALATMNRKLRVISASINLNPALNKELRQGMASLQTKFTAPTYAYA